MDPKGIAGNPTEAWVWLAPDWSTSVPDGADKSKRPAGATRVLTRTILYNDGRKVTVVLDAAGEPVGPDGQPTTPEAARPLKSITDAEQQRIFNADAAAARAAAGSTSATQANEAALNDERSWNADPANIPKGASGFRDTHAEAAARKKKDAEAARPTVVPTNTTEPFIVERQPDGRLTTSRNPNYKGPDPKPGTNLPVKGGDGKTYLIPIDAQGVAGQARDSGVPGEPGSHVEKTIIHPTDKKPYIEVTTTDPATGQGKVIYLDPQTRKEVIPGGSPMAGVKGVPSYTPDLTRPGMGLIDRTKQLDELMQAGTITWEQRQEILKGDHVLASTIASEFNTGATILREGYQTAVSQRGQDITNAQHRASLATTHLQNALGMIEKFGPYLGATPGDAGKLFRGLMAGQLAQATAYGGMKDSPREQLDPALSAWAGRAVRGGAGAPGAAPGAPAGGPNALGLGAIGAVPAPGSVPAAAPSAPVPDPAAAAAMAAQQQAVAAGAPGGVPTAGEPGGPPLAAGPVWQPPAAPPVRTTGRPILDHRASRSTQRRVSLGTTRRHPSAWGARRPRAPSPACSRV